MRRDLSSWLSTLGMTVRKATYRRSRTNHTLKSRGAAHAISLGGGELLDPRKMLAVTATLNSGVLLIQLGAQDDIAGLVRDGSAYEVFDATMFLGFFSAASVNSIKVQDAGSFTGQTLEIRNGDTITAALGVLSGVETTKIFDDIQVTSGQKFDATRGVLINSAAILMDDASPLGPLVIKTTGSDIEFGGKITIIDDSQVQVGTGSGAGDIDFNDDIEGGAEGGSGTLSLTAGTGVISFDGTIGGMEAGYELYGVEINSAASVTAADKLYLVDSDLADGFSDGLTIGDGVNSADFSKGGKITGFADDGAGIFFAGSSTNSTIKNFTLTGNTYGIYAGNYFDTGLTSDLSGTVIDDNTIGEDDVGIYLDSVAGNLDGEDAFVIGGTVGNVIAGNGEDGIYGWLSTGVEIRNNTIGSNGLDGIGVGSGISLEGGGEYLITQNAIGEDGVGPLTLGNSYDGITIDGEDGFYSYAGTEIIANDIESNAAYGVRVTGVTQDTGEDSILIFDNKIANNGTGFPVLGGGIRIDGSENIRIIDNFIGFNGGGSGNGIDIVNGSHGTAVFSNQIIQNANNGIYLEDSSTAANPVQIGDVLPIDSFTATTVVIDGDARAAILPGQDIGLGYVVDPTDVSTATLITRTVLTVVYDKVNDVTTLTFSNVPGVPGSPYAVTLGNYILGNNTEVFTSGSGIRVLATGEGTPSTVEGLEILGNVIVGNDTNGISLESTRAASFGDLSDALIAGNFVGRDPVGEDSPYDFGNLATGIDVRNGNGIAIQANYVAANGRGGIYIQNSLNVDIGEDGLGNAIVRNSSQAALSINGCQFVTIVANEIADNNYYGISVANSNNVDIGEDGLGNSIVRNARQGVSISSSQFVTVNDNDIVDNRDTGVEIVYSQFVTIINNEIADNNGDGIYIYDSEDVLIQGNSIHDNGGRGIYAEYNSDRVEITDNLVKRNGDNGIAFDDITDALVTFNIVADNDGDGVEFVSTNGVIEGNEIYDNSSNGVFINGGSDPLGPGRYHFEILGNIIRDNALNGVDIIAGNFLDIDRDGEIARSRVAGNTIERNERNGVALSELSGLNVGGDSPSEINFINLNGSAGVYVYGYARADVIGNEIDSNDNYGVEIEYGRNLFVGFPYDEAVNTIRRNGIAGVYAHGTTTGSAVWNNEISENPVGVMITSAVGLQVGGLSFPGEDEQGNHIFDNGEGIRATGDCDGTFVQGNLIEDNLTGATLASVRGLTFGYQAVEPRREPVPTGNYGNTVQDNKEGLRASGDLTGTVVAGNDFLDNTKVGIALQSAKNLTVGGFGEDSPNVISGSPIGLSASGTMTGTEVFYNQFSDNTVGISLSKATGMTVGGNTVNASAKYGISVTGNNAGTTISGSIVTNTAGLPGYEHGIYLDGARNVDVIDNTVSDSKGAGIYVTGNTSGTAVENNFLDGNRFGIALIDATNAVIGGLGEDEGNTIVGGGDSAAGDYRDGIYASGTLTGSSITGTVITNASTGVNLESAKGLVVTETTVNDSQRYGFFARGDNAGTSFTNSTIDGTGGVPGTEHGMMLLGATNLQIEANTVSNSLGAGLYLGGDNAGTTVYDNSFDGNRFGIAFVNTTNTDIGGTAPGEDNRILGRSRPGEYRDGLYAAGVNTGSSITQTRITYCWTGINLESATGFTVTDAEVLKAIGYGIYAKGTNTGTLLDDVNFEQDPVSNTSNGSILEGAAGLTIDNSSFLGDGTALYVIGGANGTIIEDSKITGQTTGLNVLGAVGLTVRRNTISGSTNGLIVSNTCTGTAFTNNLISASAASAAAASFYSVTGATFDDNSTVTTLNNGFGLYATGNNSGTVVRRNTFNNNVVGVYLNAATNIVLGTSGTPANGNTISNSSFAGLQAAGACTSSFVYDTTWTSNAQNVFSTATGLTINPPAP